MINLTATQKKINQHKLQPVVAKLERIGLTVIDKSDLDLTIKEIGLNTKLQGDIRMLRAKLARASKGAK